MHLTPRGPRCKYSCNVPRILYPCYPHKFGKRQWLYFGRRILRHNNIHNRKFSYTHSIRRIY